MTSLSINNIFADFAKDKKLTETQLRGLQAYFENNGFDLNQEIVGAKEFYLSPHYINAGEVLYPVVLETLIEVCSGDYEECLLVGSIGAAKSTVAIYLLAYHLYLLSCYKAPQQAFGLDPSSELLIVFQSINASLSKAVDYNRFRALIGKSPYFVNHFMFDKKIESELRFPNNIIVKPVSGEETAAIGQNVISAILDEVNFMSVVDKSQKSIDGGTFNQAIALYNSIARRRKSRFLSHGKLPGMVCIVSSRRYPGQFTDQKEAEARLQLQERGETSIYVYDKRVWDIKPWEFSGKWFNIFIGDTTRQPRIINTDDKMSEQDRQLVMRIPVEFKDEFERDIHNALRDIAGVSTLATHPFLMNIGAVSSCFGKHESILNTNIVDFDKFKLKASPKKIFKSHLPRFVHVDLAVTGDSAGVVMGCVTGFKNVDRGNDTETLPEVHIDFSLEVVPPKGGEIIFSKIRDLIYRLREIGVNIKWVSFDSFNSRDSIQILRQKGFTSGLQSMDKTNVPYEMLKNALYDNRISLPNHDKLLQELQTLEKDSKTGKIDHPSTSSKDIADALAGVVFGLTMRREIWVSNGVPIMSIPASLQETLKSDIQSN